VRRRDGAAPGPAWAPESGSSAAPAAAPAPASHHDAPWGGGGGWACGVTLVKERGEGRFGQRPPYSRNTRKRLSTYRGLPLVRLNLNRNPRRGEQ